VRHYSYVLEEIVDKEGSRWIFKIVDDDGVVNIFQDYDPYESGWVPMTQARAQELAQQQADAMNQLEQQSASQQG
jgi:hypothetical protein